jgi:4-hydroxy-tetrahydrodipicolinate synthase
MRKPLFTGSCVALVTPFTEDGVDYSKLEELIEWQIARGTDAILTCGTTGEASTMPDEEHKAVMKFTIGRIAGRVHVMAGTGSNDTRHAVHLTKYAESIGADSVLSVTPYYNKTTQEGLVRHFTTVAESVSIPMIVYNVPSRTNLNIAPKTLKRLSEVRNIAGVKECNLLQTAETRSLAEPDFLIYSGEDGLVIPMLSLGGLGVISVMANIIPADTHEMASAWLSGNHARGLELQLKTVPLVEALFCEVNPIPVKEAMNLLGMKVGMCRMPLIEMSEGGKAMLEKAMRLYGLL